MSEKVRCAIYTRKSTEEGLDQDFNSLDAQREACEAYIKSQKGLGWSVLPKHYDDGGISGGTMERPALRALLDDIDSGRIDLVVVYKVDRLTRSLVDFARIIETFDAKNVSFVSVTQQFNTANSMGRLTLNVLLSFAQFEREVTAERIRDKIAASKKKGMWMGGLAPFGYDARDKKLVVNEVEAETVKELFRLYLDLGSIQAVKREADSREIRTKARLINGEPRGARPFTRGHLSQLLHNPVYVGKVHHKGQAFDGLHEPIIDQETWDAVQKMLAGRAPARTSATNGSSGSLLAGLLYDETGDRLTPSHARKGDKAYRYYISSRLVSDGKDDSAGWRLPQGDLDDAVLRVLTNYFADDGEWQVTIGLHAMTPPERELAQARRDEVATQLAGVPEIQRSMVATLVEQVVISPGRLSVQVSPGAVTGGSESGDPVHEIVVPFEIRRRGVESRMLIGSGSETIGQPDQKLIELVADTRAWFDKVAKGQVAGVRELAEDTGLDTGDASRFLPLAFLAPDIVEVIVNGRQPVDLTSEMLKRIRSLPPDWGRQREVLGFS